MLAVSRFRFEYRLVVLVRRVEFAGTKVITKPDVAHQVPQYLQPLLAFVPKVSLLKFQRKYCGVVSHHPKSSRFDPRYNSAWRSCMSLHTTAATKADDDSLYRSEA